MESQRDIKRDVMSFVEIHTWRINKEVVNKVLLDAKLSVAHTTISKRIANYSGRHNLGIISKAF